MVTSGYCAIDFKDDLYVFMTILFMRYDVAGYFPLPVVDQFSHVGCFSSHDFLEKPMGCDAGLFQISTSAMSTFLPSVPKPFE